MNTPSMTLNEAVSEVLNLLTGLDLHYIPELDRYRAVVRHLNRALRSNSLEQEWSCYHAIHRGPAVAGARSYQLPAALRPRITSDDSVRLVDENGDPIVWAYFLPRDALHKYRRRGGLWSSTLGNSILFSRPLSEHEATLEVEVPVMREPKRLVMPVARENIETLDQSPTTAYIEQKRNFHYPDIVEEWVVEPGEIPYLLDDPELSLRKTQVDTQLIKAQPIDFFYPDLIVAKAAWFYAQSDPVMQPRVQALEDGYKSMMYQVIERDTNYTESPYLNEFIVPVRSGLHDHTHPLQHLHPHSDWRN